MIGQIMCDQIELDPESNIFSELTLISDNLKRGLSPIIRKSLLPVRLKLQYRLYTGFDTEYNTQELGSVNLLSFQLAIFSRVLIDVQNAEGLDLNEGLQATGFDYIKNYKPEFSHLSNVAVLVQSLYVLTDFMKVNKFKPALSILNHLANNGNLHKFAKSNGNHQYCILKPVDNYNIPIKYIEHIKNGSEATLKGVMGKVVELGTPLLKQNLKDLNNLINQTISSSSSSSSSISEYKFLQSFNPRYIKVFMLGHNTTADLSPLKDFNEYKNHFDLIHKNFVTLSRPLKLSIQVPNSKTSIHTYIYLRDTGTLSPPGTPLKALGDLLDLPKIELPVGAISNMAGLQKNNLPLFESYALRDSEITLLHGLNTEYFNATQIDGCVWIPTTVSSMGKNYVLNY
jgi:hypothetical protein